MLGKDAKGLRDIKSKTIFIRKNLEESLKEMIVYHELHHAVQTNINNPYDNSGINQGNGIGRLILEAQTQWIAEEVYKIIHKVDFNTKKYLQKV